MSPTTPAQSHKKAADRRIDDLAEQLFETKVEQEDLVTEEAMKGLAKALGDKWAPHETTPIKEDKKKDQGGEKADSSK